MLVSLAKDRVVNSIGALFSHGPRPLENTLEYAGDPGLLGPDSISWEVIGDTTAFVGGIRALVMQTAHPEVVAGVEQQSTYRDDPLGRLTRTSLYVTETTYGACPEVDAAAAAVRHAHRGVHGTSERGRAYSAGHPALAAWVHNVLTDSFLVAYQSYGARRLSNDEADRFVDEQARIGSLLGSDPLPRDAAGLREWIDHHPDLSSSDAQRSAVDFLARPPLSPPVRLAYHFLYEAALATVPDSLTDLVGVRPRPYADKVGRVTTSALRWALGSSPSWHLALVRAGAAVPPGVFRQPLPKHAEQLHAATSTPGPRQACSVGRPDK
jgi:uncharacterized protein (DUF2236 family)